MGKDFSNADKGKTFKQGGDMASKMNPGFMAMMAKKKAPSPMGKPTMKKGMDMAKNGMKKMAGGGLAAGHKSADGVAKKGKTEARTVTMKRGGKAC